MIKNDWLSLHIYTDSDLNLLLPNLIRPVVDRLKEIRAIRSFFFIRYWEGGQHLRLRLLPEKTIDDQSIIKITIEMCSTYFDQIQDSSYQIDVVNYLRENERYGGENGLIISEKFFDKSSQAVLHLFGIYIDNWGYDLAISIAIQAHTIFISAFFSDRDQQLAVLTKLYANWLPYAVNSENPSDITPIAINQLNLAFEETYAIQQAKIKKIVSYSLSPDLEDWEHTFRKNCTKTAEALNSIMSADCYENVIDSLLHMTNNRIGIYLRDEAYIWYLIRKALADIS